MMMMMILSFKEIHFNIMNNLLKLVSYIFIYD